MASSRVSFFYIWIRTCFRMVVDCTFEIFTAKIGNVSHSLKNLFKMTTTKNTDKVKLQNFPEIF